MSTAALKAGHSCHEPIASQLLMQRETRVRYGDVPHDLLGEQLTEMTWQMDKNSFLLRGQGEHYFFYRKGHGIIVERGSDADVTEEALWLNGSVYSAIASLNGLLPIHASAVAFNGKVFAFTGPAGAGKSTLVAALGSQGMPMFCDDTLILDPSQPGAIICLPGHKRLKLTPGAVRLTGAVGLEQVSTSVPKVYANVPAGDVRSPLPLEQLIFLEEGPEIEIRAVEGAERLLRLQDDHYTTNLFIRAQAFDRHAYFRHLVEVSTRIEMARFTRPRHERHFNGAVDAALKYLTANGRKAAAAT